MDNLSTLRKNFSIERMRSYETLALSMGYSIDYAVELYKLNILICNELYSLIHCLEVCLRNNTHTKMVEIAGRNDWFEAIAWQKIHREALEKAKKSCKNYSPNFSGKIIANLTLGFWCHTFDKPYEATLWTPALRFILPNHQGKPKRADISKKFLQILKIRNRIAHFEPIIKNEKELFASYILIKDAIQWMDEDIYTWFMGFNSFDVRYENLIKSFRKSANQSKEIL